MSPCQLSCSVISSPIGPYDVSGCINGLHSVQLSPEVTDQNFLQTGSPDIVLQPRKSNNRHLDQLEAWMKAFFEKSAQFPDVSICPKVVDDKSSLFSHQILSTLKREVGFGETIGYGQLAILAGKTSGNLFAKSLKEYFHTIVWITEVGYLCFFITKLPCKMTASWRHDACSSLLGTIERFTCWTWLKKKGRERGNLTRDVT